MKKKIIALAIASVGMASVLALAGCNGGNDNKTTTVTVTGSSSVAPLMEELGKQYETKMNNTIKISVTTSDSGTGVKDTQAGNNDFGMASRAIKSSETGVKSQTIAIDGVAMVVNNSCSLTNVTADEVYSLYAEGTAIGSISNAVSREASSGTRGAFDELIKNSEGKALKDLTKFASCVSETNSTGNVKTSVASNVSLMGYISLGSVDSSIKALSFNGVEASVANIKNGTYALSRPFNVVLSTSRELTSEAQAFLDYIMSTDGQKIVETKGYVSVL